MFCDYTVGRGAHLDEKPPSYNTLGDVFRPDVLKTIEETVDHHDAELRELSLDIWNHPEIAWQEKCVFPSVSEIFRTDGCSGGHTTNSLLSCPRTGST